jgi:hypothetical protein
MKRIIPFLSLSLFLVAAAIYANADVRVPKPSPTEAKEGKLVLHTGLTIATDPKSWEARLQISERDLKSLQRALANAQTNPTMMERLTHGSTQTIMAGLFLFLAVSFAGVWLARTGDRRSRKVVAGVVLVVAVIGAATVLTRANAGPPGYVNWRGLPKALSEGRPTSGGVDIEIVPDENGAGMKLIVPLRNTNPTGEED